MKNTARILCAIFAIVMIVSCFAIGASASAAYQTYTYSIDGYALYSPDAYVASEVIDSAYMGLDVAISSPNDLFADSKGNIYIADTDNNRIVCLDRYYKLKFTISTFVNGQGVSDALLAPQGLYVTDDKIWVCDTGKSRIVVFDIDGNFDRVIYAPSSALFTDSSLAFTPIAMAVDQYNRLFIVSSSTTDGIIVMTEEGEFTGYIGAQAVSLGIWEIIWRRFRTEEQKSVSVEYVSVIYENIAIDDDGFIYIVTPYIDENQVVTAIQNHDKAGTYLPVKMLNSKGDEIMKRNGFWPPAGEIDYSIKSTDDITGVSSLVDVAIGDEGTWSVIDSKRQRTYTYDSNGNLLFAFGETTTITGSVLGAITQVEAITYQGDKMLLLDKSTASFTVFRRTEYGDLLVDAIAAENSQDFDLAINMWTEVLKQNSNFDAAYVGIGQAMYRNGNYEGSLEYFEAAYDTDNWSKSFAEIRKAWMSDYFFVLIIIIVVLIVAFILINKKIQKINRETATAGGKRTFVQELLYGFHLMLHPFDGFWDLKHERRGSVRGALVYVVVTILAFYYQAIGQGYMLNPTGDYSGLWVQAIGVLVPLFLFVLANWCLTTLFEGEGSFKDIFVACSYSLLPVPLLLIPATILSNFVTTSELGIVTMISTISFIWLGILIFFGTQVTHDYTMGKNIITILGTAVGMVFIMFIVLLFSTLIGKMISLVTNIVTELQYRM
ncbi:MAG: YIP1 family protein [Clostridia bacterium]|nr:YIP1 family protein [Clostridia bacterium]